MFLSELLSVVIFNHGAESQRDKCVSDYVVNYEMEILRISLNFSTKVSLFSTWQRTDPSILLLNSHTLFTFFTPTLLSDSLAFCLCCCEVNATAVLHVWFPRWLQHRLLAWN